ncbi:MAG: Calx-beta domain-containing protein, partial [Limisphaerales bacterium]
ASNGVDYATLSGSVIIPAGLTSTNITITPINDSLLEGDESVIISLASNPGYNVGSPGSATLFIRDDEKVTVSVTATDSSASEPGSDTGLVTISPGSIVNGDVTVNFAISGTALNGVDYIPIDNFAVIPDGASEVTIEVIPFDDLYLEYTETVMLNLIANTNYNLGSANRATVNILDDDASSVPAVGFTFTTSSAPESDSPGVSVSLSATSTMPISVDYRIIGGTASSNDYTFTPGRLTFDPGEWSKSIPLTIINDSIVEPSETIRLVLNNPASATLDGNKIHTYTILDDDSASVMVSATIPTASETGPLAGNFRFSRVGNLSTNLVVNFQVTGTASSPSDYMPIGTSVVIPTGAAFVDLPVVPMDDATVEIGETVVVTLTSATGAKLISPSAAIVTIVDNDLETLPVVSVTSTNKPFAIEGSANNGVFVFTRSGSSSGALTIYFTISGTASNGLDYAQITNVVTIPDGQTFTTIPIAPLDDTLVEGDETVLVNLTVRDTYRVLFPSSALVTIQDNDQSIRVDASDFEAAEPGTNRGEFTITRFGTTNSDLTFFFNVSGTAINGLDYVTISNSITIRSNQLFAMLPIVPLDDLLREGPETVKVTLLGSTNYSF